MVCTFRVHLFSGRWNFFCGNEIVMSKKDLKILLLVFTVPFALLGVYGVFAIVYAIAVFDDSMTLVVERSFLSPDGNKKAVLYQASGGGAAGWIHHSVAILNINDSLDESVFISERTVFSKRCCDSVDVNWENDSTLQIRYIKEDEYCVYKMQENGGMINVEYFIK